MRLVDYYKFICKLQEIYLDNHWGIHDVHFSLKDIIENLKSAQVDAEPIRHGNWEYVYRDNVPYAFKCSECGEMTIVDGKYCPNCGAKMEEVEE